MSYPHRHALLLNCAELNLIMVQFSGELLVSLSHLKVSGAGISSLVYFGSFTDDRGLSWRFNLLRPFIPGTHLDSYRGIQGVRESPQLFQGRGIGLRVRCYSLTCLIPIAT